MNTNDVINSVYHGAIIGGLTVGYSMILKKVLKIKPADLSKLDIEDSLKLSGTVGASLMTQKWLISQGILPQSIMGGTVVVN